MNDNQRILVIDDDPGVRDAFKEILTSSPTSDIAERGAANLTNSPWRKMASGA